MIVLKTSPAYDIKKKMEKVYDANDKIFGTMAVEEVALDKLRNGRPVIGVLVKNDNEK